jgi:hypothetical protein
MDKKRNSDFYVNHHKEMQSKKAKYLYSLVYTRNFFIMSLIIGALIYPVGIALCFLFYEQKMEKKALAIGIISQLAFIVSLIYVIFFFGGL